MELYASGVAIEIRYPTANIENEHLAREFAARLDELVSPPATLFTNATTAGVPSSDVNAIFIGRERDWASEIGMVPWWRPEYDFGVKVVSGANCLNPMCTGRELHIIARDYPLLLRAIWLTLHGLGWRHYMPNGTPGLEELWVHRDKRTTIRANVNRVWSGAVDHLLESIAGGTSNLGWSDGTNHATAAFPNGLLEGNLKGAIGTSPLVEAVPTSSWLRHMGWTASSKLQANAAWPLVLNYDDSHGDRLSLWDGAALTGHYAEQSKLFTDSPVVQEVALEYANDKVNRLGIAWVSLSRPDGDTHWDVDFNDPVFAAKSPVTRQIELANHVATSASYAGAGIVIQAYGDTAETPVVLPNSSEVCVVVVEAYRPPGKTVEEIIDDYVDGQGNALCPLGLYQYLNSAAWGLGVITAKAAHAQELVDCANRVRRLPRVTPKVLTGEAMTEFGLYGLGYYCYMRMILDVGRVSSDFTPADVRREATSFLRDMFPTQPVRAAVKRWYGQLVDRGHKPLLSSHLLRELWDELDTAMRACAAGSDEEKRVAELCKFTRYLDLRNAFEALDAAGERSEDAYDVFMEWLFRIRDSGLVDAYNLFQFELHPVNHAALGLGTIWDALNEPPGDNRGSSGSRPAWTTSPPTVDEFKDSDPNWIADGIANNSRHGLTDTRYSAVLEGGWLANDDRARQDQVALHPYRANGKTRVWLIPGAARFDCEYRVDDGGAYVEFVNQSTGAIDAEFAVTSSGIIPATLTAGQLYEIRVTTYATGNRLWLDWWTTPSGPHCVTFDPGREGDPCGFSGWEPGRSYYFLVPDGIGEIHFYASAAANLRLFYLDELGTEQEDSTFNPASRSYQRHAVAGTGRRVMRIAGIQSNEIGFWLLNCPNLFAWHPLELLKPADA